MFLCWFICSFCHTFIVNSSVLGGSLPESAMRIVESPDLEEQREGRHLIKEERKTPANKSQCFETRSDKGVNHGSANHQIAEESQVSQSQEDKKDKSDRGDIQRTAAKHKTTPKKSANRQWQRQESDNGDTMIEIQKTLFGNESKTPLKKLIEQSLSKLDTILKEPLDSAKIWLDDALSSRFDAPSLARENFVEARRNLVKAFNYAKDKYDIQGLCVSTRFWILCDIGLASYDERTKRFIPVREFTPKQNSRCFDGVLKRTMQLFEEMSAINSEETKKLSFAILRQVWPLLMRFHIDENIPEFSPR